MSGTLSGTLMRRKKLLTVPPRPRGSHVKFRDEVERLRGDLKRKLASGDLDAEHRDDAVNLLATVLTPLLTAIDERHAEVAAELGHRLKQHEYELDGALLIGQDRRRVSKICAATTNRNSKKPARTREILDAYHARVGSRKPRKIDWIALAEKFGYSKYESVQSLVQRHLRRNKSGSGSTIGRPVRELLKKPS